MSIPSGEEAGGDVLSHRVSSAVPSALRGLTAVFGMGTGVALAPRPPAILGVQRQRHPCLAMPPVVSGVCSVVLLVLQQSRAALQPLKMHSMAGETDCGQASRAISTARLHMLPCFHLPPINVIVSHDPSERFCAGNVHLGRGFPLRCFQRLSLPDVATRRCPWRNNRYTSGRSVPVLSY